MQQGIEERFDYLRGQLCGLQTACRLLLDSLESAPNADTQDLRSRLQGIADHTVAIDVQGDLRDVPRDHRGPFYEGIRYSIEQITQRVLTDSDSETDSELSP